MSKINRMGIDLGKNSRCSMLNVHPETSTIEGDAMGKRHRGLAMVIAVVLLGAASTVASAQSDDSDADAPGAMSPGVPTDASALEAHRALRLHGYDTRGALHITLPPPARTPESASSGGDGPLQVSFERGMPAEYEGNLNSRMNWVPTKDGTAATQASVTSPGATNMRMGVQVDLPPEAEIRFFARGPDGELLSRGHQRGYLLEGI